ncbi:MAG: cation diffusion facilitator family transporter [Melioribacteraceae bacterium]|nr:cation diffusion facilitator family transporter [Melioribacteraceae bacterium]
MSKDHLHKHDLIDSEKKLFFVIILNFLITVSQIIGGMISGSLALISDALHNFSDGVAIFISYFALKLSRKPKTFKYTFGLKRAEILAAIINASTLIVISIFLIKEAIDRFYSPVQITGEIMLIVASIGLFANLFSTLLLKKNSHNNLNIKTAYLHLLVDTISSVVVIIGAIFIIFYKIYWIDPLLTILISIYIFKETYEIVKESVDILMMSNTSETDLNEIKNFVESIPLVKNIHHVHLWKLNDTETHFEAHVEVDDMKVSDTSKIQLLIEQELNEKFQITHTTLQFECGVCEEVNLINTNTESKCY